MSLDSWSSSFSSAALLLQKRNLYAYMLRQCYPFVHILLHLIVWSHNWRIDRRGEKVEKCRPRESHLGLPLKQRNPPGRREGGKRRARRLGACSPCWPCSSTIHWFPATSKEHQDELRTATILLTEQPAAIDLIAPSAGQRFTRKLRGIEKKSAISPSPIMSSSTTFSSSYEADQRDPSAGIMSSVSSFFSSIFPVVHAEEVSIWCRRALPPAVIWPALSSFWEFEGAGAMGAGAMKGRDRGS